ncbi:FtsW/RodA/SpoVE family cell cycle protein, partial [Patescibacteria group bacterium]|nr:FtsW/RodA/SpoVE family cell cycle protein [Patescibacteria group bacterium]
MQISRLVRHVQRFDWLLILGVVILFILGIAAIYSVELSRDDADFLLVKKQLIAFVLGIVAMVVSARYNYLFLRNWGKALYFLGIILLIAVLIFGKELNGTKGWFIISVISFQPVEF